MVVGIFLYYAAKMLQRLGVKALRLPDVIYDLFSHLLRFLFLCLSVFWHLLQVYQFATVALNIWSVMSLHISVTSSSCTFTSCCVAS